MQVAVSYLNFRFKRVRTVLDGEPIVLIEDGRVLTRNVHRERLTRHELEEQARLSQIDSLDKVRWAVLETSGADQLHPEELVSATVPLYLTEAEVAELLTPADAVEAVEACFRRLAAGEIENVPRQRTRWEEGFLAVMWAVDRELGLAGLKTYAAGREGAHFVVLLFETETHGERGGDRGGQARPAAHRRGERRGGEAPRARGRLDAGRDRLRLAGAQPGGRDPRGGAGDRDRRRLLPQRGVAWPSSAARSAPSRARATATRPRRTWS